MQHDGPNDDDDKDGVFHDETCRECVERITFLQELIAIQEKKMNRAMKLAKQQGRKF